MRPNDCGRIVLFAGAILAVQACSTIKSWFPDKERDYQFTNEIPELVVPDDLKTKTLSTRLGSIPVSPAPEGPVTSTTPDPIVSAGSQTAKSAPNEVATGMAHSVQSAASSGVSSLQIDQAASQAWWTVGKALSRQKLEVVERNMDKGYFFLKYDPNAIKPEDGSIFDEINFLFGDDPSQEQEYRVSLHQLDAQLTEITVQDSEGNTLSNAAATSLLKLITDGINLDLPKGTAENSAQPGASAPAP